MISLSSLTNIISDCLSESPFSYLQPQPSITSPADDIVEAVHHCTLGVSLNVSLRCVPLYVYIVNHCAIGGRRFVEMVALKHHGTVYSQI